MPLPVRSRWRLVVLLLAGILVSGCSLVFDVAFSGPGSDGPEIETELAADAWVVVFYDADSNSAIEYMTALEATEYRADDALQAAGVGFIDGNEFGEDGYELYFAGDAAEAIWKVLEPILADAPASWDRVELRDGFEDPQPRVIRP